MVNTHNLSESVEEYFEFTVKGHTYLFRHLTSEEMEIMKKTDVDALDQYLYQFITKKDANSPDFAEMWKKMIRPECINFQKMIVTEFGG